VHAASPASASRLSSRRSEALQVREREVAEAVGATVLGKALTEVRQHAVVEPGIVRLHGRRVRTVDAAADRFGRRRLPGACL
jgi:hypothetical protein